MSCYACSRYQHDYIDSIEYSSRFLQEKEKKNKIEELNEAQAKSKRQMFGNIKFIGELFKLKVSSSAFVKPILHLVTLFARREAKTRIRQSDWLKLACEKIRREQVGSIPTFLSVRANKVAKWKIGITLRQSSL